MTSFIDSHAHLADLAFDEDRVLNHGTVLLDGGKYRMWYGGIREPRPGTEEHIAWMAQMESAHGRAEVILGKQRHGPTGTVELQFDAEVTRFSTLAREDTIPEIR